MAVPTTLARITRRASAGETSAPVGGWAVRSLMGLPSSLNRSGERKPSGSLPVPRLADGAPLDAAVAQPVLGGRAHPRRHLRPQPARLLGLLADPRGGFVQRGDRLGAQSGVEPAV